MEICNLPDKKLDIELLQKLVELQKSTERWVSEIRKAVHNQNEKFNKDRNQKKNQTDSGAEEFHEWRKKSIERIDITVD